MPARPVCGMAVEILYGSIHDLPHPDAGAIKLVYFGHQSDGQKKITRQVSEAIVMKLEANGLHVVNGLSEAAALLERNGYTVLAPGVERVEPVPGEAPGGPSESLRNIQGAVADILGGTDA